MYSQISSNKRNSALLIGLFIGVLAAAGYAYGYVTDTGYGGLALAVGVSVGMTLVSWFAGDKIALSMAGAQELTAREQNPYVWNLVENLCITAGLPLPRIYLIDDPSPNAFATGRDPQHASIAFTTGIIQRLENEELEGVVAHELSHIKNLDTRWLILVAVLVGSLSLLADFFFHGSFFRRRGRDSEGGGIGMLIGIILLVLAPVIGQLIKFAVSRQREYLADASASLLTRYPAGLAGALEKIRDANQPLAKAPSATAHLWISAPSGASIKNRIAGLFSTHPPIDERIKRLREMGA